MSYKKGKQLFRVKSKNPQSSCVIQETTWFFNETCTDETRRNTQTKWDEHEDHKKDQAPVKQLRKHPGY